MDSWRPKALVIGPGGIKGLKVLGFLVPLEDSGTFSEVTTFCGVSVGSLISLLIICGYTVREIINEAVLLDIFNDIESFDVGSVIENSGLISSEPIKKHLTNLVINKFGIVPSLQGLHSMTGKSLVTTTLNVTDEEPIMMNFFDHPEMSCVDAVMYSINIPFVFYQLSYNNKICVDGGLANPYPIDYLDDGNTEILGIYMRTVNSKPISSTMSYYHKIVNSLMEQRRVDIIRNSSDKCVHVRLEVGVSGVSATFRMTIQEKANILVEGWNQGREFLDGKYIFSIPKKQKYNLSVKK